MMEAGALPKSTPNDLVGFAASLKDGTALCKLMSRVQPGIIPSFHDAPQRQVGAGEGWSGLRMEMCGLGTWVVGQWAREILAGWAGRWTGRRASIRS